MHIFALGFILHPQFYHCGLSLLKDNKRHGNYTNKRNVFSQGRLKLAAQFYFKKYRLESSADNADKEAKTVGQQFSCWVTQSRLEACTVPEVDEFYDDPAAFWLINASELPELSRLATFLLCCTVQSADCERVFKDFDLIHTKARNRLNPVKTRMTHQIKTDLRRQRPVNSNYTSSNVANKVISSDEPERLDVDAAATADHHDDEVDGEFEDAEEDDTEEIDTMQVLLSAFDSIAFEEIGDDEHYDDMEVDDLHAEIVEAEAGTLLNAFGMPETPPRRVESPADLDPWPDSNVANFPQENASFFNRIRNVRTDKVPLVKIFSGRVPLPELKSLYHDNKKVDSDVDAGDKRKKK